MKKVNLLIAFLIFAVSGVFAQVADPVKWSVGFKKFSDSEAVVFLKADIDEGWHIYELDVPEAAPSPLLSLSAHKMALN